MARKSDELYNEVLRKVSMANKRLQRLEKNDLEDLSPAYREWRESGKVKFSVKGKTRQELERELIRLDNFLNAESSTVRGANKLVRSIARTIGVKGNLTQLKVDIPDFFEVASRLEQILQNQNEIALALSYEQIWQAVRNMYKRNKNIIQSVKNSTATIEDIKKYFQAYTEERMEDAIEKAGFSKNGGSINWLE